MSSTPLVSIVVPAYNAAATIAETLKSLCEQTYPNLEVIAIDDGSRDNTSEVVKPFLGKIKYIQQSNAGQAAALNHGWKISSGEIFGYLSADDIYYPECVSQLVNELLQNSELSGVYPDYDLIDANSKFIRRVNSPDFSVNDLVEKSLCQPGPGAIFWRKHYEKTGGWNTSLRLTPDFDFWLRLTALAPLKRYPHALAGFRVHEESQSFAPPSMEKSEEPHRVIADFFQKSPTSQKFDASIAQGWAHTLSARLHLRAGRLSSCRRHALTALRMNPRLAYELRFWKLLGSGAFGRLRYQLQAATQKSQEKK